MKAVHKNLVAQATAARKAIRDKMLDMVDMEQDLSKAAEDLEKMKADLSAIETEAASIGFAVSDLHAAVKL